MFFLFYTFSFLVYIISAFSYYYSNKNLNTKSFVKHIMIIVTAGLA
jgi:hypothetical protein